MAASEFRTPWYSSIAARFGLLIVTLVVATGGLMWWKLAEICVERVVEHEMVDLADDTNLIAYRVRTQIQQLRGGIEQAASEILELTNKNPESESQPLSDRIRRALAGFLEKSIDAPGNEQSGIEQERSASSWGPPYLQFELYEILPASPGRDRQFIPRELVMIAGMSPGISHRDDQAFLDRVVASKNRQVAFSAVTRKAVRLSPPVDPERLGRSRDGDEIVVAAGVTLSLPRELKSEDDKVPHALLLTMSLSQLGTAIPTNTSRAPWDSARSSPRGQLFVLAHREGSQSEFLIHSRDPEGQIRGGGIDADRDPLMIQHGFARLEEAFTQNADDRQAMLLRRNGVTLPQAERDHSFRRDNTSTPDSRGNQLQDSNAAILRRQFAFTGMTNAKHLSAYSSVCRIVALELPDCRIGPPTESSPRIKVSAPDAVRMAVLKSELANRIRAADLPTVSWEGEQQLETFGGTFCRIDYDPDVPGNAVDMAFLTSFEEVEADAYSELNQNARKIFGLMILAAAAAVGLVAYVTQPLKKLIVSIEGLAAGRIDPARIESEMPMRNRSEIGVLARAYVHTVRQVQERSDQLTEALERNRTILERAADGIIVCDQWGYIELLNRAASAIFQYSPAEAQRQRFDLLLEHEPELEAQLAASPHSQSALDGLSHITERSTSKIGQRKDGSRFPLEISVSRVSLNNDRTLFTVIARDVTQRKLAEDKIRQLNSQLTELNTHLDRRVNERTAELEKTMLDLQVARDQALDASRAKSAFLAQMSHELRTPLNVIINYAELIRDETADNASSEFSRDLQKIIDNGRHLSVLINDVLDLSKIEANKMELSNEEFPVLTELETIISTVTPLAQKNGNAISLQADDHLGIMQADRTRVRQVLLNLLSNACKFTHGGRVDLRVDRPTPDWLQFQIQDTGIGMTPEQLQRIFKPFEQADGSTTRKYGGTGLGLSITERLCHLMGGNVCVHSEWKKGSTFTVRLPASPAAPIHESVTDSTPSSVASASGAVPGTHGDILVIDDDGAVRELLQRFLTKEGFSVMTAASGEEGLERARISRPALITLDVMMPSMDGWEVLTRLKADPELRKIPVVMLSIVDNKELGFSLGAVEYLEKPIDREHLLEVVHRFARRTDETPRILIVEDQPETRDILRRLLSSEGWAVCEAENGRIALDMINVEHPDLVLLDLMMPEMDGFEFLDVFRQGSDANRVPVLVLTAMEISPVERQRLNGRVSQVLQKGTSSLATLLEQIKHLMMLNRSGAASNGAPVAETQVVSDGFSCLPRE